MSSSRTEASIVEVSMPQMGVSVAEGTIVEWRKRPGEWVEARARLVEEQNGRSRQQSLRQLDAAGEATRESLDQVATPLAEAEPVEELGDALGERAPAQTVEVPVVAQVLLHRELAVDARVLERDADGAADFARRRPPVVPG